MNIMFDLYRQKPDESEKKIVITNMERYMDKIEIYKDGKYNFFGKHFGAWFQKKDGIVTIFDYEFL